MLSNLMNNQTLLEFLILPFSSNANNKLLIVGIFSIIYLIGIIVNSLVIAVICRDIHLHIPMYLFFCNLSTIDTCFTTATIPKLLHILLSGNGLISSTQCFTQMYAYFIAASAEEILLFLMGLDRYIAICHPLHYHQILGVRKITVILVILWVFSFINPSFIIIPLLNLTYDRVVILHQFFCDAFTVFNKSYGDPKEFYIVICADWFLFGLCPFLCNVVSYIKVFGVIASMKSSEARGKTFSTCLSHLIVMMIYYTAGASHVIMSFQHLEVLLGQVLSAFLSTVVPMINPLIYSLRNHELKKGLQKLLKIK